MLPQFIPLFILIALIFPASAYTLNICSVASLINHSDSVITVKSDTFVICNQCPDASKFIKITKPTIAIKISERESSLNVTQSVPAVSSQGDDVFVPTTVFFKFNDTEIPVHEVSKLDALKLDTPLSITGFTCPIGQKEYNQRLSEHRAIAVANYLQKKGAKVVHVEGKGECCLASTINQRQNRRVEIVKKGEN